MNEDEMEAAIAQEVRPIIEERLGPDIGRALVGLLRSPPPSEEARRALVWVLKQNSALAEGERSNGS